MEKFYAVICDNEKKLEKHKVSHILQKNIGAKIEMKKYLEKKN